MLTAVTMILGSEQYRLGLRLTNYLWILTLYSNIIWRNVIDKGRVRLGSIRNKIIGIMRVSICLGAILIQEYLDFYSGYSAPRSRMAGIYSYSGISRANARKIYTMNFTFQATKIELLRSLF